MSIKIITASVALAVASTAVFAGPADAATARGTTHLHATKKHSVVVASTMRPGVAHLHNDGVRPVVIIRKKHDGIDKLVRYGNSERDSDGKKLFSHFTFVAGLQRHDDIYTRLSRGTYFVFDGSVNKLKAAKIRTVVVRGATRNAVRPASTRNLTIGHNGTLSGATTGTAHTWLRVRNATSQMQIVSILRVPAKTTDAQFADLLAHPTSDKLESVLDGAGLMSGLLAFPHQDVTQRSHLGAGRYLEVTFQALFASHPKASQLRGLTLR